MDSVPNRLLSIRFVLIIRLKNREENFLSIPPKAGSNVKFTNFHVIFIGLIFISGFFQMSGKNFFFFLCFSITWDFNINLQAASVANRDSEVSLELFQIVNNILDALRNLIVFRHLGEYPLRLARGQANAKTCGQVKEKKGCFGNFGHYIDEVWFGPPLIIAPKLAKSTIIFHFLILFRLQAQDRPHKLHPELLPSLCGFYDGLHKLH